MSNSTTNNQLSITNSKGRQVNLLNEIEIDYQPKKRYHCTESGCQKSFTTSGHLARHHRIHTGEKNFHCIYPGCPSKFSRQDNMMQHYRTHLSSRSRHHQYMNHYPQHCQHIYYNSDTGTELYSLRQEGVIHNNRGWSFSSSSSSSSSTSSSNQYFTPSFHTSTPQYRQPLSQSQSQSQSQNWNNNSSNNAYSSPPSFYNYNDPV